jgi:hypothetical protein
MAILSTSGQASWKLVKFDGSKYSQFEDILSLFKNAK